MKLRAKWMYSPMNSVAHAQGTARQIAQILNIEAAEYKAAGRKDAARALRQTAMRLRRVAAGQSPQEAFGWPNPLSDINASGGTNADR